MKALVCVVSGATVAAAFWLHDLVGLSRFTFAGVTDEAAAARVLDVTRSAVLTLELKLFAVHLAAGALAGALFYPFVRNASRARRGLGAAGFVLGLWLLALLGMMGTYPQLFADRFWLAGGIGAAVQRIATHTIGPRIPDGALVLLVSISVLNATRSLLRGKRLLVPLAAGTLLAFASAFPSSPSRGGGNVLILASDSLRSDRVEDAKVMPFTEKRLANGSLYRYALTPIARTYPAWVSTLTGTEPRVHGVRHMFPTVESRRDIGETLFTELRDRGYFTFAASDFAGDVFPGFEGGFDLLDTPHLTVDTLARSTVLNGHTWSLPLLRLRAIRRLFPFWRNVPSLADPEWVVDDVLSHIESAGSRRYAGLVFFSTAHFPYVAPHPDYRRGSDGYRGRYLYHVPPVQPDEAPGADDIRQIRARYDAALSAIDRAMDRLLRNTGPDTLVVITGDHGEELYEESGLAGHGDTIRHLHSSAVPIFIMGPGVARGKRSSRQVRLYDLPATVLGVIDGDEEYREFGDGLSLLRDDAPRPVCVETGIWFWPSRPLGLRGKRLEYPGIAELLEMDPSSREMVLKRDRENLVETAKERGLILGNRLYREQLTPSGIEKETLSFDELDATDGSFDIAEAFEERCVASDPNLYRRYGAVIFDRAAR